MQLMVPLQPEGVLYRRAHVVARLHRGARLRGGCWFRAVGVLSARWCRDHLEAQAVAVVVVGADDGAGDRAEAAHHRLEPVRIEVIRAVEHEGSPEMGSRVARVGFLDFEQGMAFSRNDCANVNKRENPP
jgi:hypothetical protein